MMDIFKGLGTSAEGKKTVFNFLSDEDLGNPLKINKKLALENIKVI